MKLNYHHLHYFWTVAHTGSLAAASLRLNLSQSALSIQIKSLEARLGHRLFDRRGRRLLLTEVGRVTLHHAETIFSTGEELIATLQGVGQSPRTLRIGALATLSRNFQVNFLRPVLGREDIKVILRSGSSDELMERLRALQIDEVLMNHEPPNDGRENQVVHRVSEQSMSLVGRPDRLDPVQSLETLLDQQPMILPTKGGIVRAEFDALTERLEIKPQVVAEVDDMAMMRLLAREGIGLALVPPIAVQDELSSGRLVEAYEHVQILETFYAVTLKRRFPNALLMEVLEAASS